MNGLGIRAILAAALVFAFSSANAVPLHYDATSLVGSSDPVLQSYFGGATTVVSASIDFDVSPGTPSFATLSAATGSITWNDGTSRVFTISGITGKNIVNTGQFDITFGGTGLTIGADTMIGFAVFWDLGVNPFTTALELSDLLLSASVTDSQAGISPVFRSFESTDGATTTGISAVPEPSTLALFAVGLAALGFMRRRRKLN